MATESFDFETLVTRFNELGSRDRRAVLAQLAPADRARVEAAMTAKAKAERREAERVRRAGRQFAGYSAWLSPIVEAACTAEVKENEALRPAAKHAIADIHRTMHNENANVASGWSEQLRRWGTAWLAPQDRARS